MQEFIPGQRWINSAELQLGLGTILSCEHRTVTISFPAAGETRTYAKQASPLSRVIFSPGDQLESDDGQLIIVSAVKQHEGLIRYQGADRQDVTIEITEQQLSPYIKLLRPAERLFNGQIDQNKWFNLRYQTLQQLNHHSHSELYGLTGCRTQLIPHQLYIAHEVANRHAPRVLLADEVGLGKTIEAGLILHHQLLSEHARRVLIIVPESLIHQWLVEMLRRFNLLFSIFDQPRYAAMVEGHDPLQSDEHINPFLDEQLVLCSLEFLVQNQQAYQHLLNGEWDLLVVDEAHHLQWCETQASEEYQLIEQLALQIRGVLLLTATPEQLGKASHFARLRLLDADRFCSLDQFIAQEKEYQPIAQAVEKLLSHQSFAAEGIELHKQPLAEMIHAEPSPLEEVLIKQIIAEGDNQKLLDAISGKEFKTAQQARQQLVDHLLDRHGTGRVLFRNTRTAVKGFPQRSVYAHPLALPEAYKNCIDNYQAAPVLDEYKTKLENTLIGAGSAELFIFPEQLYQAAANKQTEANSGGVYNSRLMSAHWTEVDPRTEWLNHWLDELRSQTGRSHTALYNAARDESNDKVLVIAASAQTAIDLAAYLRVNAGIHAALFHEGLSLIDRDRAAAFFADKENGSRIMICSEIGSEGRNFQFAHQLVLFDLPLNPDLLEQRIGRLDRIGQSERIKIHVPYLQDSAQSILFRWYHEALNAFEQTCPAGHRVFTQLQPDLIRALVKPDANSQDLIDKASVLHSKLKQALHQGRDRLLEFNSCREPMASLLKDLALKADQTSTLPAYMDRIFDVYGVQTEDHSEACYIIGPGEQMLTQFPGLPDDGLTITYDRSTALSNEDIHFLTWEHPMVIQAMDMVNSSEMGNTAMTTIESEYLRPGTLLMECLFLLETAARGDLQADRYLPPTMIRILVDENGHDYSEQIPHACINQEQQAINPQTAIKIIQAKQNTLRDLLKTSAAIADGQAPRILTAAQQRCQQALLSEVNRLKALAQINPNIRQDEIEYFIRQQKSLDYIFDSAKPRLDALRIIIAT